MSRLETNGNRSSGRCLKTGANERPLLGACILVPEPVSTTYNIVATWLIEFNEAAMSLDLCFSSVPFDGTIKRITYYRNPLWVKEIRDGGTGVIFLVCPMLSLRPSDGTDGDGFQLCWE